MEWEAGQASCKPQTRTLSVLSSTRLSGRRQYVLIINPSRPVRPMIILAPDLGFVSFRCRCGAKLPDKGLRWREPRCIQTEIVIVLYLGRLFLKGFKAGMRLKVWCPGAGVPGQAVITSPPGPCMSLRGCDLLLQLLYLFVLASRRSPREIVYVPVIECEIFPPSK